MGVGVKKGKLQMEEYNPEWPKMAQDIIEKIKSVVPENAIIDIRHVGSTAIPDMLAKPLIDIAVKVKKFDDIIKYADELEAVGIFYAGEVIPEHREFGIDSEDGTKRICHIHVLEEGNPMFDRYLDIVDYCSANEKARRAYKLLKESLLLILEDRPELYGKCKHEFMNIIEADAKKWKSEINPQ